MKQYIYILSNPSMPGLIKVGKTTTHPDQRMSELHSTGVPTPFILEFSAEVDDCSDSERKAHRAIESYRVAKNREFFCISVEDSLKIILPAIGHFEVHTAKQTYEVRSIVQELVYKRAIKEEREFKERKIKESAKIELERKLSIAQENLKNLGDPPTKPQVSGMVEFLSSMYNPLPFGWIAWTTTIISLFDEKWPVFIVSGIILFFGLLANEKEKELEGQYKRKTIPFDRAQEVVNKLYTELRNTEQQLNKKPR